jgi:hypothetical protein
MGPSPDGKHVGREKLSVESQPGEELAFRFSICPPNLLRMKTRVTTNELGVVSGARAVMAIGKEGPGDGVILIRHKLKGDNDIPDLKVPRKLNQRVESSDGAYPVVVLCLLGHCVLLSSGNLVQVRGQKVKGAMVSPIVVPEGGRFSIAKRNLGGGPEERSIRFIAG